MKKIHYGWFICAGCFLMMFVTIGLCTSVHAIYQPYLIERAGLSQAQGSMITTVRCLFSFAAIFFVRRFHKLTGLRLGCAVAVICLALAYIGFSVFNGYVGYLCCAVLLGFANGLGGTVPMSILINRWFESRKALALGICSAGSGCAGILMPVILTKIVENYGVNTAFRTEAALVGILALLIYALLRSEPAEKGLTAYSTDVTEQKKENAFQETHSIKDGRAWIVFAAAGLMGAISTPAYGHMTVLYAEAGMVKELVAAGVSIMGFALIVGKCSFGALVDRFGGRLVTMFFGLFCIMGYGLCCFAAPGRTWLIFVTYLLVGLGVTLSTLGIPVWTTELFSKDRFDATVHKLTLFYVGGEIVFNEVPGLAADWTGSYIPAFVCFALIAAAVIILVLAAYAAGTDKNTLADAKKSSN